MSEGPPASRAEEGASAKAPDPERSGSRGRIRTWVLFTYWAVIFVMTHIPDADRLKPPGLRLIPHSDKIAHFLMFAGLGLLWRWALGRSREPITLGHMCLILGGGAIYAILDEWTQSWVGRETSVGDFAADMLGLILGLGLFEWMRLSRGRTRRPSAAGSVQR